MHLQFLGDRTYTATWTANEYTITYDAAGGTVSSTTQTVAYDSDVEYLISERDGYKFMGWYENTTKYENGKWTLTCDLTLVAKWEFVGYSINYELNGGTNNKNNPSNYNTESDTITLADPSRTGYTFLGWTFDGQSSPIKNPKIQKGSVGNKSFTANWEAISSTITLDPNGGSCNSTSLNVTFDQSLTLPTPVWEGHTFSGWYMGNMKISSGKCTFTEDTVLVAQWDVVEYKISYAMNGGTNSNKNPNSYNSHDSFTLSEPTKKGYTFLGWTFEGQTSPTKNVSVVVGTTGDKTYTANWQANTYTITFDANGGTVSPTAKDVIFDTNVTLPTPTEKTGYTFSGWFVGTKQYTTGTWTTDSNVTLVAKWTARTDITYVVNHYQQNPNDDGYTLESFQNLRGTADASVTPIVNSYTHFISPSAKTVTVKPDGTLVVDYYYDRATYDLTYVTNGGDSIEKQTYKYGQTLAIPQPVRSGYTFGGWFADVKLTNSYSATATLNADTTIYAYWSEENKPTDFTYSGSSAITVSAYNGMSTTMWIPAYIGGIPVTTISNNAFKNGKNLLEVVVTDNVTSIGEGAFYQCSSLQNITLPFVGAKKDGTYSTNFGYIFGTLDYKYNQYYVPSSLKTVVITSSSLSIGYGAFYDCKSLTSITVPNGVVRIGERAFYNCSNLTSITIPNGIVSIGESAFYKCSNLTNVTISDSITCIDYCAFSGCTGLTEINFKGTKAQWNAVDKGENWDFSTPQYTIYCTDGNITK